MTMATLGMLATLLETGCNLQLAVREDKHVPSMSLMMVPKSLRRGALGDHGESGGSDVQPRHPAEHPQGSSQHRAGRGGAAQVESS
jgi:hypothetical protein